MARFVETDQHITLARQIEEVDISRLTAHLKISYGSNFSSLQSLAQNLFVIPVYFSKEHNNMLAYTEKLLEYRNGVMAIDPKHTKLITPLRTAIEKGERTLDKEATSHDDLFDAFRMSLQFWH
ncbi:MAG: hypothetical protein GEU26_09935 [Nitrososphaeraceae archaeon]|nr:hypothetical protein [Nitrososphaeraceae archaeon]